MQQLGWTVAFISLICFEIKGAISNLDSLQHNVSIPMPFQKDALRISNDKWNLVKSRWAIVQYEDRPIEEPILELMRKNKDYCARHDYSYIFLNKKYHDVPPYWAKVKSVHEILQLRYSDSDAFIFEGVMWMDTDAVVHSLETPIDKVGQPEKAFICSPDPSGIGMSAEFNAGVWIVKNTDVGREIMNSWMRAYDPAHWIHADGKWSAKQGWAGETFEQGSFEKHILPRYRSSIEILPWQILQGVDAQSTKSFALHLFSYGPALAMGLIRMDDNVLRMLRTKHTQGIDSTIPPGLLLTYKVNLGAALLDMANRAGDPREYRALYDEAESVLLSGIELEPACDNCRRSLASVRKNRALRG